jgi:MFS family permease
METAAAPTSRLRILDALQHRDFRLLFAGQTISQIGDAAFVVALGWRAFTLTNKASSLAIVLLVEALGLVATLLIGGVLADRYSRRLMLIGSDLARGVLVAGLAIVDATGHLSFGVMIGFVALHGLGSGLFQPAFGGILPLVVEEPSLGSANALIGVSRQAAIVLGPAFAGSIYGVAGSSVVFAVDAASFLVSALFLWPARPRTFERAPTEGLRKELTSGLRYVLRVRWLWRTIGTFTLVLMIGYAGIQVLLPKLVEDEWNGGVGSYGLLFTLQGVGMVFGSIVLGQTTPQHSRGKLIYGLLLINNVLAIGLGLSPSFWGGALVQVGRGFCVGFAITLWDTTVMQRVPQHMLSRVISMDWFGSLGLYPAGLGLWAILSGLGPPGTLIAAAAALCSLLFLLGLADPAIRDLD